MTSRTTQDYEKILLHFQRHCQGKLNIKVCYNFCHQKYGTGLSPMTNGL